MMTNKDRVCVFFGSAFGLGLLPVAPGSFGALLGVAMHLGVAWLVAPAWQVWALVVCLVVVCGVHFVLTPWAQRYWDDSDPGNFVLDEVAGYLVVPVVLMQFPLRVAGAEGTVLTPMPFWPLVIAGFFCFRVFDIIKLPGARYIDNNWHNAWGVLLDDIVSGLYASAVIWVGACFYLKYFGG